MSLYVGGKKYNITMAKWRGFWSVTIHGFPGTIIDCGSQKVIGDDGKVTFKFAESDTYTFIAMKGTETKVLEVELVDGEYFVEKYMYVGITLLEYIESTGTQYINTNLLPSHNDEFMFDFTNVAIESSYRVVMGSATAGQNNQLYYSTGVSSAIQHGYFFNAVVTPVPLLQKATYNIKIYNDKKSELFIDDALAGLSPGIWKNEKVPLCLFARNANEPKTIGRFHSFKWIRGKEVLLNLVPVKDDNGIACMFDLVTKQFFYNQGTGDFIAGPVKE